MDEGSGLHTARVGYRPQPYLELCRGERPRRVERGGKRHQVIAHAGHGEMLVHRHLVERHHILEKRLRVVDDLSQFLGARLEQCEDPQEPLALDIRERGVPSNTARRRLLNDAGVAIVHGAAYGDAAEGTLRVSFASGGETLTRGLALLRAGLEAL